ncbi:pyrroloquinoline quinone biosynthesis peptide chaperone PqqD [Sphingopyxis sp. LARHCG72]
MPTFRRGVTLRFDTVRGMWLLLAPEKLFMPDEIAVEILKLIDGSRSIDAITADLANRFEAPAGEIAADVIATLGDLSARGAVQL